ncbi:MAG: DNA primase [Christensenellaceae bacterium]|nr:DNA primase [Christensenellaceae bacterium]
MALFPDSWLRDLIARSDLVAIASEYTQLRPKGRRMWGCCPFHGEKTPSFSVTADSQLYYCFGCHAGGGVVQFIMQAEKLTYAEAVKALAQRAGLDLPEEMNDAHLQQERAQKERLYTVCREAARYYYRQLLSEGGKAAQQYLIRRGIDSATVKAFGLGYAPPGWENLVAHLSSKGYAMADILAAGLALPGKKEGKPYDAYRDRVIYPIWASNGRVVGFGARTMGDDNPKYLNTGDTPIFNKRYNLYAIHMQKGKHLSDLIMVEGYMDVISLYKQGVQNAVASLGTALTQQQARLMKRYAPRVYICYDGDAAGQHATLRGLDILAQEGLDVRVMSVPGSMDPDEYIRKNGAEAYLSLKDAAQGLTEYKLDTFMRGLDMDSPDGREQYAKTACAFLGTLQPVEQERYLAQIARRTGYSQEAVRAQCGLTKPGDPNRFGKNRHTKQNTAELEPPAASNAELTLLACMTASEEALFAAMSDMAEQEVAFGNPVLGELAERLLAEQPDVTLLIGELPAEAAALLSNAIQRAEAIINPAATARDCVKELARDSLKARIAALSANYGDDPAARETLLRLQKRYAALRNEE